MEKVNIEMKTFTEKCSEKSGGLENCNFPKDRLLHKHF